MGRVRNDGREVSLVRARFAHFPSVCLVIFFSPLSRDRPGGGRGSYHGPPADWERSRWTVNKKRTVYNIVMIQ